MVVEEPAVESTHVVIALFQHMGSILEYLVHGIVHLFPGLFGSLFVLVGKVCWPIPHALVDCLEDSLSTNLCSNPGLELFRPLDVIEEYPWIAKPLVELCLETTHRVNCVVYLAVPRKHKDGCRLAGSVGGLYFRVDTLSMGRRVQSLDRPREVIGISNMVQWFEDDKEDD